MKRFSLLVLVVILLAGYGAGISYTGLQAEQALEHELDRLERESPYPLALNLIGSRGFLSSHYRLEVELDQSLTELRALLDSDLIPFDLVVQNGFFTADYRMTVAPGRLQDHLQQWQVNPNHALPLFTLELTLDPFHQAISHTFALQIPALNLPLQQGALQLGTLQADGRFHQQELNLVLDFDGFQLQQAQAQFNLHGLSLTQHARLQPGADLHSGLYEFAHVRLNLEPVYLDAQRSQLQFESLSMELKQEPASPRLLFDNLTQLKDIHLQDKGSGKVFDFQSLVLDSRLDMDLVAAMDLTGALAQMRTRQVANPMVLLPLLDALTQEGINLQLNQFQLVSDKGALDATGHLTLGALALEELMNDPDLLKRRLLMNVELTFDPEMVEAVQDEQLTEQLDNLKAQGYLIEQGGRLISHLQLEQGEFKVNEIPLGRL